MKRFAAKTLFISLVIAMSLRGIMRGQLMTETPNYPAGWGIRINDPDARIDVTVGPGKNHYALAAPDKRTPARVCQWPWAAKGWPVHKIAGQDMFTAYLVRVSGAKTIFSPPILIPCARYTQLQAFQAMNYVMAGDQAPMFDADVNVDGVVDGIDVSALFQCSMRGYWLASPGDQQTVPPFRPHAPRGYENPCDVTSILCPYYVRIVAIAVPFGPCDGPPTTIHNVTAVDVLRSKGFKSGDWLAVEYNAALYSSPPEHPVFRRVDGSTVWPVVANWYWNY